MSPAPKSQDPRCSPSPSRPSGDGTRGGTHRVPQQPVPGTAWASPAVPAGQLGMSSPRFCCQEGPSHAQQPQQPRTALAGTHVHGRGLAGEG